MPAGEVERDDGYVGLAQVLSSEDLVKALGGEVGVCGCFADEAGCVVGASLAEDVLLSVACARELEGNKVPAIPACSAEVSSLRRFKRIVS